MGARRIEEVIAWQLADNFKQRVYALLRDHPEARADVEFRAQLSSSAASAAMNIAEGFYRFHGRDFARFLSIALGSLGEARLWLEDGIHRGYFSPQECEEAFRFAKRCRMATLKFRAGLLRSMDRGADPRRRRRTHRTLRT